jgi:hypothetical protein
MTATVTGHLGRTATESRRRTLDWTAVLAAPRRRKLQLALGLIWLIDAALQYQPYFFGRDFVTQTIEPTYAGTPYMVARPSSWAAHIMVQHITLYNSLFATIQLLIAAAIFFKPTVRLGLALSIPWSLGVWWFAEGIGGITLGASPVMGAPGAVLLYALIALLVWPRRADGERDPDGIESVATGGALGSRLPLALWAVLWGGFIALGLETVNRAPSALGASIQAMASGEPGWIQSMDRGLANLIGNDGTEWSLVLAALFGLIAIGVFAAPTIRPAIILAVLVGAAFWVAQDFGATLTGSGTDVNSGPLLVLLAATYWPLSRSTRNQEARGTLVG